MDSQDQRGSRPGVQVGVSKFRRVPPLVEELSRLPPSARGTDPGRQSSRLQLVQIQHENQIPEDAVPDAPASGVLAEDAATDDGPDAGAGPESDSTSDSEPDSTADATSDPEPDPEPDSDADSNADPEPDSNASSEPDANVKCWGLGA